MKVVAGILVSFFCFLSFAWGQAKVNEGLETAYYWVDGVSGSDLNPGTQKLPFQTLGYAMKVAIANNHNRIGTHVTVNPATYRESVLVGAERGDTPLPITFEAAQPGTAIVSGADVWTGWIPLTGGLWYNTWPYHWGLCKIPGVGEPNEQPIVLRREMVFVNGTPMTQVLSLNDMQEGTFSVDEIDSVIYLWPPFGTDMNTATIEVSTRSPDLAIYHRTNMVFRGMVFQYANSCDEAAGTFISGQANNILLDNDQFIWNNAEGLAFIDVSNHLTVRNSVSSHNGETGFFSFKVKDLLYQSDEAAFNGWRTAQGGLYAFNSGGGRFHLTHYANYPGFVSEFNQADGIHWDTDNANIGADSVVLANNLLAGATVEKSEGPFAFSNSIFCNNGVVAPTYFVNSGITYRDSEYITLTRSTISNNPSEILLGGLGYGQRVNNWETGEHYFLNNKFETMTDNTIVGADYQQYVVHTAEPDKPVWYKYQTTLTSDYNQWWNPEVTEDFIIPIPRKGTFVNLSGWISVTGQDKHSQWAAASPSCPGTPDAPDYWLIALLGIDNTVIVSQGSQVTVPLTTVSLDMSGTVNLTADVSAISGATASFNPSSIPIPGTSILTITVSDNTPKGTYSVNVIGNNSGSVTRTVQFAVQVD